MIPLTNSMATKPTRRGFLAGGVAVAGLFAVPLPAFALSTGDAEKLVHALVADIFKAIDSGKTGAALYRDFEKIFTKYGDVPAMARYTLGVDARTASKAQMAAYTKSFQTYIARKYGKRFREFIGGRIEVNGARVVKKYYEVKTTAYLKGEAPFEVSFHVTDRSGSDKFFNMFIEGINLLLTERTEIQAMLDRRGGDLNKLTKDLKTAG